MTQEHLNRLLIDRSLRALPTDVAALLDAYLELAPQSSKAAVEIEESVSLAREVLRPVDAARLPPLKVLPPAKLPFAAHRPRWIWRPAELAAALALGVGLGFLAFRPAQPSGTTIEKAPVAARVEPAGSGGSNAFWSVKRLAQMEPRTTSTRGPRITWNAWLQNPQANN